MSVFKSTVMPFKIISSVIALVLVVGCAGKTPNPIRVHNIGDEDLSCTSLTNEMEELDDKIRALLPKTDKTGKNVGLGVAGYFLIVPWFFMDFSDAERIEIEAFRSRYNHLARLYNENKCGKKKVEIPSFTKMKK